MVMPLRSDEVADASLNVWQSKPPAWRSRLRGVGGKRAAGIAGRALLKGPLSASRRNRSFR